MKYAAIVTDSIWVPGDERSRTHPGHGYPEHTVDNIVMHEFSTKSELEAWVLRETSSYSPRKFRLIEYTELAFDRSVSVKVKP